MVHTSKNYPTKDSEFGICVEFFFKIIFALKNLNEAFFFVILIRVRSDLVILIRVRSEIFDFDH